MVKIQEKAKYDGLILLSPGVGLYFDAAPMRLYCKDKVCRSEEVIARVAKLYDRNCKETLFTPSVALPIGNVFFGLLDLLS